MKTMLENDRVILCPEGRIDSNNALTVEAEMFSELKASQDMTTHYSKKGPYINLRHFLARSAFK